MAAQRTFDLSQTTEFVKYISFPAFTTNEHPTSPSGGSTTEPIRIPGRPWDRGPNSHITDEELEALQPRTIPQARRRGPDPAWQAKMHQKAADMRLEDIFQGHQHAKARRLQAGPQILAAALARLAQTQAAALERGLQQSRAAERRCAAAAPCAVGYTALAGMVSSRCLEARHRAAAETARQELVDEKRREHQEELDRLDKELKKDLYNHHWAFRDLYNAEGATPAARDGRVAAWMELAEQPEFGSSDSELGDSDDDEISITTIDIPAVRRP